MEHGRVPRPIPPVHYNGGVTTTPNGRLLEWTVPQLLDALASGEPVPGGGAAAAVVDAQAAALLHMALTVADRRAADPGAREPLTKKATALLRRFIELAEEDAAAFARVAEVLALPRGTDDERGRRSALLQEALAHAAEVPLATARLAVDTLSLAAQLVPHCPRSVRSDVLTAVYLAHAACSSALANVDANALSLEESPRRWELARACEDIEAKAGAQADEVRRLLEGGLRRWRVAGRRDVA